jgi:hypothetical protein
MSNKIPVQNTGETDRGEAAGTAGTGLRGAGNNDSGRKHRERACTYAVSCPPSIAASKTVQYLKGRSSRLLQEEYEELKKRYWGQHLWARGYFCVTAGSVTKEMIQEYIANQFKREGEEGINFKVEGD